MGRPTTENPLLPVTVRLPKSMCEQLRAEAETKSASLSDIVRSHIEAQEVKPLGNPRPQKRLKRLPPPSGADPQLLRQLAAIGNNLNQIAMVVNRGDAGFTKTELLLALCHVEQALSSLGRKHAD